MLCVSVVRYTFTPRTQVCVVGLQPTTMHVLVVGVAFACVINVDARCATGL